MIDSTISNFKSFKQIIASLFDLQDYQDIYFSQMCDGYSAAYKPKYPESSSHDIIINTIDKSGAYLRGNYETIYKDNNKISCIYFDDIKQLSAFTRDYLQH